MPAGVNILTFVNTKQLHKTLPTKKNNRIDKINCSIDKSSFVSH